MNEEFVHKQQKILGYLCILLPVLSIGFGVIGWLIGSNDPTWFHSISDTYYANSKMFMIGLLFACGIYFWSYKGYDLWDNIITSISAITSFLIVVFPCFTEYREIAGLFCLPVEISQYFHNISALILYTTFCIQVMRFRKHGATMTYMKKIRNNIYLCCFITMCFGASIVILQKRIPFLKELDWFVIIGETFLQIGYGIAWLVKAECFKKLNDR